MIKRKEIIPGFIFMLIITFGIYFAMTALQNILVSSDILFSYNTLETEVQNQNLMYSFLWFLGDMTEAQFIKSIPGAIGMIVFSLVAYILFRKGSKFRGFDITFNGTDWPWVFLASSVGLLVSNILYLDFITEGWIPTFVAFVSVPACISLLYGPGWKNALTGGILGGLFTYPIAWFVITIILRFVGLPDPIGNVTGMWVGGIVVLEICRYFPWMRLRSPEPQDEAVEGESKVKVTDTNNSDISKSIWYIRRIVADYSEPQFFANEWATFGLVVGSIISWIINPEHVFYGNGLFPALLFSQFLSLTFSNFFYIDQWGPDKWFPTFVPCVSVGPVVVLTFGNSLFHIVIGSFLGGLIAPAIAQLIIKKMPLHWHAMVGNTFSMMVSNFLIVIVLQMI